MEGCCSSTLQLLRSRFLNNLGFPKNSYIRSSLWPGLREPLSSLHKESRWLIGDPSAVYFWLDDWLGYFLLLLKIDCKVKANLVVIASRSKSLPVLLTLAGVLTRASLATYFLTTDTYNTIIPFFLTEYGTENAELFIKHNLLEEKTLCVFDREPEFHSFHKPF